MIFAITRYLLHILVAALVLQNHAFAQSMSHRKLVKELSEFGDRRTGSEGNSKTADFIYAHLDHLSLTPSRYLFPATVRTVEKATIRIAGKTADLQPFLYNAITPQGIDGTLDGPLIYVGTGSMEELSGKEMANSIILMEFDSGINWQKVASFGARAIIFVDRGEIPGKHFFKEKEELSPIQFPMFWVEEKKARDLFGHFDTVQSTLIGDVSLQSTVVWQETFAQNIYCLIPGSDPDLAKELIVVEAFFDNSSFLPGRAPGADEATSIVTLLKTAEYLQRAPPGRSVLILASNGHDQSLAGMREIVWSIRTDEKEIEKYTALLKKDIEEARENLKVLTSFPSAMTTDRKRDGRVAAAIKNSLKTSVDEVSRELVLLRLEQKVKEDSSRIGALVKDRFNLRQLGWKDRFDSLSRTEKQMLDVLIPLAMSEHETIIRNSNRHLEALNTAIKFRQDLQPYTIAAFFSLHLSTHGNGVGSFHEGWLYQLKEDVNRTGIYSAIGDVLQKGADKSGSRTPYFDSLRPERMRSWDTWFLGKPYHGGEVSSLAGYLGLTLATIGDGRHLWGTPWDSAAEVDYAQLADQAALVGDLIMEVGRAPNLSTGKSPKNGFSTISGRANLLLQGELFADYPAHGTTILAFQGQARFYATIDRGGGFFIKGVADKKNVNDKVIIEGYRFDEESGRVKWAIDKKETDKENYRLRIRRQNMKTDLILFSCTQTTIFDLLEPRNFNYLTKMEILDGRRDAPPQHFWYSRLDTRDSTISSIYTEPGTWLKLTLSDTVLTRKLILSNSSKDSPSGYGYPVDTFHVITNTTFRAAQDIWSLLQPRITNLEKHGIVDPQISRLQQQGLAALKTSRQALTAKDYATFKENSLESLALAGRVYVQVEKTQKDVLFGVLFYIALFVPFAFCMERFLFNYANIYKRIAAFTGLLLGLIAVIYNIHPAFQLAYSPMVVILAFFIIGLSLMVTLIIFFRFEEEMILLQRRTSHKRPSEISQWKAFVASFFLGVSNLRRRRLRTILTCLTLVILTFTIMSFTTVKSSQKANTLLFQEKAPYQGLLLKSINWQSLPREAKDVLAVSLNGNTISAARVWLEGKSMSRPLQIPVSRTSKSYDLHGLIGLTPEEARITGLDAVLISGRWLNQDDRYAILLDSGTAAELGIEKVEKNQTVSLWGMEFTVIGIFDAVLFDAKTDLDGEPLTPVTFPQEVSRDLSEAEQEAMESGDDVRSLQSRYQHIPAGQVAVIPAATLLAMGGQLKSVAIQAKENMDTQTMGARLVERFNLPVFAGEKSGVWFFSPSNTLSYSGVPNILIPLIISMFIVLNTMISSVHERKNEIGVYTSVGLAPSHVSFLFIAEAMALAVISVVLGYLLAQVSAALFSSTSYWSGITVNYSSLAGVAAMLLVIAVVLVSVIYPSKMAAKIAIPDVNRTFLLPKPVDNTIEVVLPFFMKYEEHESIGGFIYNYFNGHQDISHGIFSTGAVDIIFSCDSADQIQQMIHHADDPSSLCCMHIRTKVWLAPFDFGIMQVVDVQFCPARENSRYLEIKITLERNAGEIGMWQRVNTIFLHDIRKQLLIWRSIDDAGHLICKEALREAVKEKESPSPARQELQHG